MAVASGGRELGIHVLAISGSLRARSINSAFCRAFAKLARPPQSVSVHAGLEDLPLFNFDLDTEPPGPVVRLREAVSASDALLFASPEYAHGISGPLKNALDWLVSVEALPGKRVAVVNASPRAVHADAALREVLATMSLEIVEAASPAIQLLGACESEEDMLRSPGVVATIATIHEALRHACIP